MKKTVYLLVVLISLTEGIHAQKKLPTGARRMVFNIGIGGAWTGGEPFKFEGEGLYYNPKKGTLGPRYSILYVPVEMGFSYVLNRNIALRTSLSISKVYSRQGTTYADPAKYWEPHEHIPYSNKEIGIGLQWTRKKLSSRYGTGKRTENAFVAPVVRKYAELMYSHAFYHQITEYYNEQEAIQFGNLSLGLYRNYFFSKSNSFMIYGGCRIGIPIYRTRDHIENILQNTEGNVIQKSTWKELDRTNTFLNYFQLRWGVKYVLPNKKVK